MAVHEVQHELGTGSRAEVVVSTRGQVRVGGRGGGGLDEQEDKSGLVGEEGGGSR